MEVKLLTQDHTPIQHRNPGSLTAVCPVSRNDAERNLSEAVFQNE